MPRKLSPGPLVCVTAFVIAAFAVPSFARDNSSGTSRNEVRHQVVSYSDLNLNSARGADELLRRISSAADNVCGNRTGPRPLDEHRFTRGCIANAQEEAVYDVGHPLVMARYYGRTPEVIIDDQYSYYRDGSVAIKPHGVY